MVRKVKFFNLDVREHSEVTNWLEELEANSGTLIDVKTDTILTATEYPMTLFTIIYEEENKNE